MASAIEFQSFFWKEIFETNRLAVRMAEIAALTDEGLTISPPINGCKVVKAWPASALGDNFMSDAYIVQAIFDNGKELRAFAKIMPHNSFLFLTAKAMKLPKREIDVYGHLLQSLLVKVRSEAGVTAKEVPLCVPTMYYGHWDEVEPLGTNSTVVVMQDLKALGFRMVDKRVGCTFEEAKLTLGAMAHYHALTLGLMAKCKNPDGTFTLPESIQFIPQVPPFHQQIIQMLANFMPHFISATRKSGQEEAAAWLEKEYREKAEKALTPQEISECGRLVCILHADCWNNNMMYRYDENGKPVEMKMVDWQVTRLGHPGTDVTQFIFTSTSPETFRNHRQDLLNHYYDTFSSSTEKLGLGKYDRDLFMLEVKDRFRFGFFTALTFMAGTLDTTAVKASEERDAEKQVTEAEYDPEKIINEYKDIVDIEQVIMKNDLLRTRAIDLIEATRGALQKRFNFTKK